MLIFKRIAFAIAIVVFSARCTTENNTTNGTKATGLQPANIVVVVDLSNRLVKSPGQDAKDKEIILVILDEFQARQKKAAFLTSKDILRLVIAPQPNVPAESNDDFRIDMRHQSQSGQQKAIGFPKFKAARAKFEQALDQLYSEAVTSPYTGADLYTFFCTELRTKYIEKEAANKVIVLTDGYLQFDRQFLAKRPECTYMRELDKMRADKAAWRARFERKQLALCPCGNSAFPNTDVILLETAPLHKGISVYEFDMVEHYWKTWFEAMSLPAQIEPHNAMIGGIRDKIHAFINN